MFVYELVITILYTRQYQFNMLLSGSARDASPVGVVRALLAHVQRMDDRSRLYLYVKSAGRCIWEGSGRGHLD
jgi:hypothetical protein